MNKLYLGLVHNPVLNKFGEIVTTSITNLDMHDISRTALTFGVKKFFIINRLQSQRELFQRVKTFWESDVARKYNENRTEAMRIISFAENIDEVTEEIKKLEGDCPLIITTSAKQCPGQTEYERIGDLTQPLLLLLGTGNGLAGEVLNSADYCLTPIPGVNDYNHLSVRSAAAIILDRLTSNK
ncbi:MAG: RNA methyltransferase [Candidatus Cloacimonetes bacterium]|nr:RNA methyltransferase [Candidatus Cloacimonadota bacterium]